MLVMGGRKSVETNLVRRYDAADMNVLRRDGATGPGERASTRKGRSRRD